MFASPGKSPLPGEAVVARSKRCTRKLIRIFALFTGDSSAARFTPSSEYLSRSPGLSMRSMASASFSLSPRGTRSPAVPSEVTNSGPPPCASVVITGQPTLMASDSTWANPSSSEASTKAQAWAANCSGSCTHPIASAQSLRQSCWILLIASWRPGPSPTIRSRASCRVRTSANASISRSSRFQGVILEVFTKTGMAVLFSHGWGGDSNETANFGIGGGTTCTSDGWSRHQRIMSSFVVGDGARRASAKR